MTLIDVIRTTALLTDADVAGSRPAGVAGGWVAVNGERDILGFHPGSAFQLAAECNGAAALIECDTYDKRLFLACSAMLDAMRAEIKRLRVTKP